MDFTPDDIASLGDKLAALDLTDGEAEALRTLVAVAADTSGDADEVSGFAYDLNPNDLSFKADFGSLGLKVGPPRGVVMSGGTTMGKIIAMGDGDEI